MTKAYIAFLILILLVLLLVSCSTNAKADITPDVSKAKPLSPNEIIVRSLTSMDDIRSFNFKLKHNNGSGTFIDGFLLTDATGHVSASDDLHVETNMLFGNLFVKSGIIKSGTKSFVLNPLTNTWLESDAESSPFGFFNPKSGLKNMLKNATNLQLEYSTKPWYEIVGSISAKSLADIVGSTTANNVTIIFHVNKDNFRISKVEVMGKVTKDDKEDITRTINLSGFNEKQEIHNPNP